MPIKSPRPTPHFPTIDILTWIFDERNTQLDRSKPLFVSVADPTRSISNDELRTLTKRIGHGLRELAGVKDGDVVLCASQNHLLYPAVLFGTICAGALFTGSNPSYTEYELLHQLRDSGARVVFATALTLPTVLACAHKLSIPDESIFLLDGPRGVIRGIEALLQYEGRDWSRLSTFRKVSSTTVVLTYSSGTTGLSKGCELTHWNLVSHGVSSISSLEPSCGEKRNPHKNHAEPVYLAFLPFFHAYGMTLSLINNSRMGHLTYVVEKFAFPTILQAIQNYRINHLVMAPPVAVLLAKSPIVKDYDLSSVTSIMCGAAPLGTEIALAAENAVDPGGRRNFKLCQAWGMSEITAVISNFDYGDWDEETGRLSVGQLGAGIEAMIVDDDENEVAIGESGEVWLRAPFVFKGYWKNEKATREAVTADGWLRTGDVARVNDRGMFYIVDRKKVKGFQVAPAEIEATLLTNPDVADAAVIGVPRRDGGEEPRAYIVRSKPGVTASAIHAWVAQRLIAYKHLTGGIHFIDAIPKSASGKILRRVLRDRAAKADHVGTTIARL
ncbi:acetyl-CoA synthetase-like protein [Sistotremastrum niveocremeum HHB9708]|uniref:Acetyl-CoA synthetase-like protein n=1 Tax=Sistotremastrum niveocremeum HHB9708 TaxID=1314777 RepID=A0A164W610_9AGAM|nr:acetyl-CoA synthetase-like protein [Sistotremastrum niveocremeum HHB9708]